MKKLDKIELLEDRTARSRCDEGFIRVRRLTIQNHYGDGTSSRSYSCDIIERKFIDAVAVVLYTREPETGRILVGLREGLRPVLYFRHRRKPPIPDPQDYQHFVEVVAGALEDDDLGWEGLRRRAVIEVREEAGFEIDPAKVELLGGGLFSSPGTSDEKVYLAAAEVDPRTQGHISGDGSPMEEAARVFFIPLEEALERSMQGDFEDGKTELCLWRLAWKLGFIRNERSNSTPPCFEKS